MDLGSNRFIVLSLLLPMANLLVVCLKGTDFYFESGFVASFKIILATIGEEMIFRGFLQPFFIRRLNVRSLKSIILVNVLFGVSHFVNVYSYGSYDYVILQAFCAFCIGIFLSLLYLYKKSLVLCIITHSLVNITSERIDEIPISLSINEFIAYSLISVLYLVFSYKYIKNIMGDEDN